MFNVVQKGQCFKGKIGALEVRSRDGRMDSISLGFVSIDTESKKQNL